MPWAALAPPLIGAGGTIGGALIGRGGGGSSSADRRQLQELFGEIEGRAGQEFRRGKIDWKQFHKALDPVRQWFEQLLTGDRTALMEALGPEVAATGRQYNAVSRAIAEFAPRGGGRTAQLAETEFAKARDIGEMFQRARPMAAQGLEGVASLLGGQATAEAGMGMAGLADVLSGLLGMRSQDIQRMLANREFAAGIGRSLSTLLTQILHRGGAGAGGGSSSGDTGNWPPGGF